MVRHIVLLTSLALMALPVGVALVPGEHEQWTMLVRDGRNQEALAALEARYRSGKRDVDAVLHLYKLYMSFAEIEQATQVVHDLAADHPLDPAVIALLAKHYADVQDEGHETRALEQQFALAPAAATARDLLSHYRLAGSFDRERRLLQALLARAMISPGDAERLGLLSLAAGDLYGARDALLRFDQLANPERSLGRLALFDLLVRTGDKTDAFERAVVWIKHWRKGPAARADTDNPAQRLIGLMRAADEAWARRLLCPPPQTTSDSSTRETLCEALDGDAEVLGSMIEESEAASIRPAERSR